MMVKLSTPSGCSEMTPKLRGANMARTRPCFAQDVSRLNPPFKHGVVKVALQDFDAPMGPIFVVPIRR